MEKHTCKLCFKHFSNGRALGGHMRSHVISTTAPTKVQLLDSSSSAFSSSSSEEEAEEQVVVVAEQEQGLSYGLRENPRKSFRLVDPEFSSFFSAVDGGSSVVQDRESETESSKAPSQRRRSKRPRRHTPPQEPSEPEPLSSVSDTTPEEDVALSLMMLSRDIWTVNNCKIELEQQQSDGSDEDEEEEPIAVRSRRSKYQCGTCKKVFRSYQALGGHRASHKKLRGCIPAVQIQINDVGSYEGNADRGVKVHECPVCFRVFASGQALGGHKRSHLSSNTTTITFTSSALLPPPPLPPLVANTTTTTTSSSSPATTKYGESLIDLNLPAPMEDEDDVSQVELSAVSDAGFVIDNPSK